MNTISSPVKITAIAGNRQRLDGGAMFGNAPRAVWQKWMPPDELGRVELQCRAMLVEHNGKKILCETGIGAFLEPKLADRYGVFEREHKLLKNLQLAGVCAEDIDYVILSHLHFDHAGGLLPAYDEIAGGNNSIAFPRAQVIVGAEAYARSKDPHERDRASFIPGLADKLETSGRLIIVEKNGRGLPDELAEFISFRYSHGHTPGQMHTVVTGASTKVFFAGDLIPGSPWVHVPITMGYDRFPELLIDEKKELYKVIEPEGWLVFFTHDPDAALANISRDGKGRYIATNVVAQPTGLVI